MAKKYQLVEADGLFGLVTDNELSIPDGSNLNIYMALLNEQTGRLYSLRKKWSLGYGDSFVTKSRLSMGDEGWYNFSGVTHYLGKRLSPDQFESMSQEDLDKIFEKFKEKHPDMDSNYEHTWRGQFMKLVHGIAKGYENVNKLSDAVDNLQLNMIEAMIPVSKMATEHIARKTMIALDQLEEKIEKKLQEREDKAMHTQAARKPSLDSIIASSSAKAAELRQQRTGSAPAFEHTPNTPFDERSLF